MKRKTLDVWLATDNDGEQYIYCEKPEKHYAYWNTRSDSFYIGKNIFKQTAEDKPRKIEMILRDNK